MKIIKEWKEISKYDKETIFISCFGILSFFGAYVWPRIRIWQLCIGLAMLSWGLYRTINGFPKREE